MSMNNMQLKAVLEYDLGKNKDSVAISRESKRNSRNMSLRKSPVGRTEKKRETCAVCKQPLPLSLSEERLREDDLKSSNGDFRTKRIGLSVKEINDMRT